MRRFRFLVAAALAAVAASTATPAAAAAPAMGGHHIVIPPAGAPPMTATPRFGLPTSNLIPVPWRAARHRLSCEATSLEMVLAYYGKPYTQDDVMAFIGQDLRPAYWDRSGLRWGDPYQTFVGSVDGYESNYTGYGMKYPPLAAAARFYGLPLNCAGEGVAPADVYAAILAGHPVIVWGSYDYVPHSGIWYTAFDGRRVFWGRGFEHVFVVAGVDSQNVGILDPFKNVGVIWISRSQFEWQYAQFNDAALVF
jgi:uncharacterized protein YvpB